MIVFFSSCGKSKDSAPINLLGNTRNNERATVGANNENVINVKDQIQQNLSKLDDELNNLNKVIDRNNGYQYYSPELGMIVNLRDAKFDLSEKFRLIQSRMIEEKQKQMLTLEDFQTLSSILEKKISLYVLFLENAINIGSSYHNLLFKPIEAQELGNRVYQELLKLSSYKFIDEYKTEELSFLIDSNLTSLLQLEGEITPPIYTKCFNNGKTFLWAQLMVESELTQEFFSRLNVQEGLAKAAVLDTGFDTIGTLSKMANRDLISVAKGVVDNSGNSTDVGSEIIDEEGHGTAVSGLIGGGNGLGIAPLSQLRIYRITKAGNTGSASSSVIDHTIMKACNDGHNIINLSFGSRDEEENIDGEENQNYIKMAKILAEKGCILVKSAGNSNFRHENNGGSGNSADDDLRDVSIVNNYLRVGSVSYLGNLSDFSSTGNLNAPGGKVFTLKSTTAVEEISKKKIESFYGYDDYNKCILENGQHVDGTFISGTSFSSPIAVAVLANINSVLLSAKDSSWNEVTDKEKFERLTKKEQSALLIRILKASTTFDVINSYRAVVLAYKWLISSYNIVPSVNELRTLLKKKDFSNYFCEKALTFTTEKEKILDLKRRVLICTDDQELDYKLFEIFLKSKNLDLAGNWLRLWYIKNIANKGFSTKRNMSIIGLWNAHNRMWETKGYWSLFSIDYQLTEVALELLPIVLKFIDSKNLQPVKKYLNDLLSSYELKDSMLLRENRGFRDNYIKFTKIFQQFNKLLGHDLINAMEYQINKGLDKNNYYKNELPCSYPVSYLRLLNIFSQNDSFREIQNNMEALESNILDFTEHNTCSLVLYSSLLYLNVIVDRSWVYYLFFDDYDHIDPRDFNPLFKRHQTFFLNQKQRVLANSNFDHVNVIWVLFNMSKYKWDGVLFENNKDLVSAVLKQINVGNGWGESNNIALKEFISDYLSRSDR